jgi:hypothetical protein
MAKEIVEHKDKLGRILKAGDCVAYPVQNSLVIGTIKKINPKMVKVAQVPAQRWGGDSNKYPADCVKLDGADVTMYLIKNV